MQASPTWNPTAAKENGKLEQFTPNLTQRTSMMRKGDRQSKVKALLTTVEGLGSGSLNKCLISGFAKYSPGSLDSVSAGKLIMMSATCQPVGLVITARLVGLVITASPRMMDTE